VKNVATLQVSYQMGQMSIHPQTLMVQHPTTSTRNKPSSSYVLLVHNINQKGNQQPRGKKKGKGKKINTTMGGVNDNKDKNATNARGGERKKRRVKFPCKLFVELHPLHECPKFAEAKRLLDHKEATQPSTLITNSFLPN